MNVILEYTMIGLLSLFIIILFILGYRDAMRRDEALLKKYGSVDKIPPEERRDFPYI